MKKLLLILAGCFVALAMTAQTSITPTQIATTTDFSRPAHTRWNNQTGGQSVSGVPAEKMFYRRYTWADVEGNTIGAWRFDERIKPDVISAIQAGAMFNMGIMTLYPDGSNSFNNVNNIGGQNCTYPTYVHDEMQATGTSDFLTNGNWVPNYNHPYFISRHGALHTNLRNWFDTASYTFTSGPRNGQTIFFRDVLAIFDVRGVGTYGEMHHANLGSPYNNIDYWAANQPGRFPTIATWKTLIDQQVDAFDDYQLTFIMNILDNERFDNTRIPGEVGHYALTKTSSLGLLGFRRDQWGDPGSYYKDISLNSTYTFGSFEFDTSTQNRWKFAPITGEPINDVATNGNCTNIVQEFRDYHTYGVGNGNYSAGTPTGSCADSVRAAFRIQGSRCTITGGSMTTTLTQNATFNVTVNYQNIGIAPEYMKWKTQYEIRNQSTDAVAATFTSSFTPKLFLPQGSATAYNENFNLGNVTPGTYRLVVKIIDTTGFREPYPLGITGRESDGAYQLRNNITVQAGGNQAPVSNAGNDITVQLPGTGNLSGSGTDDVSIASYAWSQMSGPNTATIVSPTTANTSISNLVPGTYIFRLTVQDGDVSPLSDIDDVTVTVLAAQSPLMIRKKHGKLILQ